MQETQVQSLIQEDMHAAEQLSRSTAEPVLWSPGAAITEAQAP